MKKTNVVTIAFLILTTATLIYDFINNDSEKLFLIQENSVINKVIRFFVFQFFVDDKMNRIF